MSDVDREVESYLRAAIVAEFPQHGILGEEGEDRGPAGAEFWWVLDPLDGTTNYVNHLPLFGVSVAVLRQGMPQAGAIFLPGEAPLHGGVYHCVRGGGSWLNEEPLTLVPQPAAERHLTALPAHYWWRFRPSREMARRMGEVRSLGSVVCELALTARGVFQYAAFGAPRIWDVAAGALLVAEAGGAVLVREDGQWHPLAAFTPPRRQSGPTAPLRDWRAPLVAGNAETAPFVARELRGRGWLGTLLWGLWRLRRRVKGRG